MIQNAQTVPPAQDHAPIRLIATDIDGTLLDSENRLPAANQQAAQQAWERGVKLAVHRR